MMWLIFNSAIGSRKTAIYVGLYPGEFLSIRG
jgi:hypothetical protein